MHNLNSSFVLGYHGCSKEVGERLLKNEPFLPSENEYDWLGTGIYFWEANPDRAIEWAKEVAVRNRKLGRKEIKPFAVGVVIDLGFCLDLISSNGIKAVSQSFADLEEAAKISGTPLPKNEGGDDLLFRNLDRAVIEFLHLARLQNNERSFDTVRALFPESTPLYENSGFRKKTHIQICVRNPDCIKGVFRVPKQHFSHL